MFEDLIKEKKKDHDDIKRRCPYCNSAGITLYAMVIDVDRTYKQKVECRTCKKTWHIRYDEFLTDAKIEAEPIIQSPYPSVYVPMDP